MADLHEIVPGGDVELILQYSGQLVTPVENAFEDIRTPSQLGFRRKDMEEPLPQCMNIIIDKNRSGVWPQQQPFWKYDKVSPENEPVYDESEPEAEGETALKASQGNKNSDRLSSERCVRIRVSSTHLALASAYFKRNFKSGMSESITLRSEGFMEFRMEDEDPEVMLIIMNIIHGRFRQVPRSVDLDMLTKIAISWIT